MPGKITTTSRQRAVKKAQAILAACEIRFSARQLNATPVTNTYGNFDLFADTISAMYKPIHVTGNIYALRLEYTARDGRAFVAESDVMIPDGTATRPDAYLALSWANYDPYEALTFDNYTAQIGVDIDETEDGFEIIGTIAHLLWQQEVQRRAAIEALIDAAQDDHPEIDLVTFVTDIDGE